MALEKTLDWKGAVFPKGYVRHINTFVDTSDKTKPQIQTVLHAYVDAAARQKEIDENLPPSSLAYDTGILIQWSPELVAAWLSGASQAAPQAAIYSLLKTLPQFEGAKDV